MKQGKSRRAKSPFNVIPRSFAACVYAVEMQNGMVKVGFSRNPRTRMQMLDAAARREFRTCIRRGHVSHDLNVPTARAVEASLITRLSRMGKNAPGKREYFFHVAFGAAVTLLRQMVRAMPNQRKAHRMNVKPCCFSEPVEFSL